MKKRFPVALILILSMLFTLAFSACSSQPTSSAAPSASAGPKVVKYIITEPQSFYTPDQKTGNELLQYQLVYESLGRVDEKGTVSPFLAEKFDVDAKNKTITITVRKNVKFSDGTVCDGAAIKWNLDQFAASGRTEIGKPTVTVNSDGNVVCKWTAWQNNILTQVAGIFIMSPTAYDKGGATDAEKKAKMKSNPVGTGAFTLKSWVPASSLTYVKNPNYRTPGQPAVDEVDVIPQPDQTIAKTQFLAGGIDLYAPTDNAVTKEFLDQGMKNVAIQTAVATRVLVPNSKDKTVTIDGKTIDNVLYDPDIRTAVALSIDRNALVKALSFGLDAPTTQWMFPSSPSYVKEIDTLRAFNLEKAKQIMTSKGYSASKMCNVTLWSTAQNAPFATAVQAMLKEAFINVNIKSVQFSVISQMMGTGGSGWDGMIVFLGVIAMDPLNYYGTIFSASPTQYVSGIDRTAVIQASDLDPKYAQFAGKTIPELYNYALTTDKGDSLLAIQALTYYVAQKDIIIGALSNGASLFTSKRVSGYNLLGTQWTPEQLKLS